jgi:hypothetical protein
MFGLHGGLNQKGVDRRLREVIKLGHPQFMEIRGILFHFQKIIPSNIQKEC